MSEPTEQPPQVNLKTKKTRTPEQLEVLSKAREKALQIRKENAKLRQAEKQIEKDKKSKELLARKQKVEEYNNPKETPEPEPVEIEPETPKVVKRITKEKPKKEKKKKIIYVEESSESEEEEIVYVKKSKPKKEILEPLERVEGFKPPPKPKSKGQTNYEQMMKNTFGKCREF